MKGKSDRKNPAIYAVLLILTALFLSPVFIVLMNSFKGNFYISDEPFSLPFGEKFAGFDNFIKGFTQSDFFTAFVNSAVITLLSVIGIVILTSMAAWYIVRVSNRFTKLLYYVFTFSMIVPFQMVMHLYRKALYKGYLFRIRLYALWEIFDSCNFSFPEADNRISFPFIVKGKRI